MRILHVSATSTISGANRYAFDLAAGQADLGHDTLVCMPENPGAAFGFAAEGVGRYAYGQPRALHFLSAAMKYRPDVIHCHDGSAARWLRYYPKRPPSIVTLHIHYKRKAMAHFDGVHVLADWQMPGVSGFKGAVRKVNNWMPQLVAASDAEAAQARTDAGVSDNDFLVVFMGRLTPVKGVDVLLSAFRKVKGAHVRLAIVGDGELRSALEAQAGDDARISFMGFSDMPAKWYGAADLLVMPSRHEPFALVALEAMSCDTPVLASDLEGFQEIFADRPACRFPGENADALAAAIQERIGQKSGAAPVRAQYDLSRFDRRQGIAAVTDFYTDVMASKGLETAFN